MAIDVSRRESAGWWMQREFKRLADRKRQRRLQMLYDWRRGDAPLPDGLEAARSSFQAFMRMSRTNFADLIVSSVSERMIPVGFRTAEDGDETGDAEAASLWVRTGLDVRSSDLHDMMLCQSEAFVIVGEVDEELGAPVITAEDPRWMVGEPDPSVPWRLRAALKVKHDDVDEVDRAYLYLPGKVFVATRPNKRGPDPSLAFEPRAWTWDTSRGGDEGQTLRHNRMPVVRFENKDGQGEFEPHLDALIRINNMILQRMVITTLQAYKQRAIKGLPNVYPVGHEKAGQEIDYTAVFSMDPAALWQLPATAEIWESGTTDITPILSAIKDDVGHLSEAAKTPMRTLTQAGANQSAEGANVAREGLVFKVGDRIIRTSHPWAWVMSLAFEQLGDPKRANLAKLEAQWRSPQRLSLAERADAASKSLDIPWRSRMIYIWEFPPAVVDRMASERMEEQLLAAQVAAAQAAMQGTDLAPQPDSPLTGGSPVPAVPPDVLADPFAGLPPVEVGSGVR